MTANFSTSGHFFISKIQYQIKSSHSHAVPFYFHKRCNIATLKLSCSVFQLESEGRRVLGCRKGTVLCDKIFVRCLVSYVQIYNICISFSADKSPIFCVRPLIICLFSIYLWFVFQISCICITKAWQCTGDSSVLNFIS